MSDTDLFGVQNPSGGEIGYCCVLGEFGEVFRLVVYLGSAGLEQHRKIQSGKIHARSPDAVYSQNCLTAWFGSRSEVDKNDLKLLSKILAENTAGDDWPQFRSHTTGLYTLVSCRGRSEVSHTLLGTGASSRSAFWPKTQTVCTAPGKNLYLVQVPKQQTDSCSVAQPSGSILAPGQQTLFPETVEDPGIRMGQPVVSSCSSRHDRAPTGSIGRTPITAH